jgi:cobalt/nickel transport system permease protein/cobalt/nickel transport protein
MLFVGLGLGLALLVAGLLSPWASSSPDGLERVALDHGFADRAADSAVAGGPLADYAVAGVADPAVSTGLAGVLGVLVCFVAVGGLVLLLRRLRPRRATDTG